MAALREIEKARQIPGEAPRRWFTSESMDLIVWLDAQKRADSFQLCYGKPLQEHALTWTGGQLLHQRVDDGSIEGMGHKHTPLLIANGEADTAALQTLFKAASSELPPDIVQLVTAALNTAA